MYPAPPPVAENCAEPPGATLTVAGVTVIDAGTSWIVTDADCVWSCWDVAVIVMLCRLVTVGGAR